MLFSDFIVALERSPSLLVTMIHNANAPLNVQHAVNATRDFYL
jgi:hypothetical protein